MSPGRLSGLPAVTSSTECRRRPIHRTSEGGSPLRSARQHAHAHTHTHTHTFLFTPTPRSAATRPCRGGHFVSAKRQRNREDRNVCVFFNFPKSSTTVFQTCEPMQCHILIYTNIHYVCICIHGSTCTFDFATSRHTYMLFCLIARIPSNIK